MAVKLGLLHSVKEIRKFPLDRRSDYRCWGHKEWTENIFLKILEAVTKENILLNKPQNIFNVNESSIQLIKEPGKVEAKKGAKYVHVLIPREREKM